MTLTYFMIGSCPSEQVRECHVAETFSRRKESDSRIFKFSDNVRMTPSSTTSACPQCSYDLWRLRSLVSKAKAFAKHCPSEEKAKMSDRPQDLLLGMPPEAEQRKNFADGAAQTAVRLLCASVCLIFTFYPMTHPSDPLLSAGFTLLLVNSYLSLIALLLASFRRSSSAAVLCAGILNGTALGALVVGSTACAVRRFGDLVTQYF